MKARTMCFALAMMVCSSAMAQDIESKLSGNTAAQGFSVKNNTGTSLFTIRGDGKLGIGTTTPEFGLTLAGDGGILAKGVFGSSATLSTSGGGTRFIWYPRKAAFRVGKVSGSQWNESSIGDISIAIGAYGIASGQESIAIGADVTASAENSIAFGAFGTASGQASIALGSGVTASGFSSTALGTFQPRRASPLREHRAAPGG